MTKKSEFKSFVMDQLAELGEFETKSMFGGTALLRDGVAFAKVKHGTLWLKVDDGNRGDFLEQGMPQYTYGKDNGRRLNFFQTPTEVIEDAATLVGWAGKAMEAARRTSK